MAAMGVLVVRSAAVRAKPKRASERSLGVKMRLLEFPANDLLVLPNHAKELGYPINEQISAMGGDEMEELFNQLRADNIHPHQGLLESLLTVHLIARAPANMSAIKIAHPSLPVLGRTYQRWGQADQEAALAHIEGMENETFGSLSESDAALARRAFESRMHQLEEPTGPGRN